MKKSKHVSDLIRLRQMQRCIAHKLSVCTAIFVTEWYYEEDLQLELPVRRKRMNELIRRFLGTPDEWGLLQNVLNETMDGILDRLRKDYPRLSDTEVLVYSYSAAGFTNELSYHLAGLSCANANGVMKSRMKEKIQVGNAPGKEEYLVMLPQKGCRIGKEMLYLQPSSIINHYGIVEKNQKQGAACLGTGRRRAGQRMGPHQEGKQTSEIHRLE